MNGVITAASCSASLVCWAAEWQPVFGVATAIVGIISGLYYVYITHKRSK